MRQAGAWKALVVDEELDWVYPAYAAPFNAYGSAPLRICKKNGIVFLEGASTCSTANHLTTTAERVIAQIAQPELWPLTSQYFIHQGSSNERWLCIVKADGSITGSRYSGTQNAGVWLPHSASWVAP